VEEDEVKIGGNKEDGKAIKHRKTGYKLRKKGSTIGIPGIAEAATDEPGCKGTWGMGCNIQHDSGSVC